MIDTPFPPLPAGIIQVLEGRIKMESLRDKKLAIEIQRLVVGINGMGTRLMLTWVKQAYNNYRGRTGRDRQQRQGIHVDL